MSDDIQVSKEGLRVSYLRLLSDSASGLILAVSAILYVGTDSRMRDYLAEARPSTELVVFLLVAVFIVATPLGLAVNAVSWYALGWLTSAASVWCAWICRSWSLTEPPDQAAAPKTAPSDPPDGVPRLPRLRTWVRRINWWRLLGLLWVPFLLPTWQVFMGERIWAFFGLEIRGFLGMASGSSEPKRITWIEATAQMEGMLEVFYPGRILAMGYIAGLEILLRNLAIVVPLLWWPSGAIIDNISRRTPGGPVSVAPLALFLVGGLALLVLAGLVAFYKDCRILYETWILCQKHPTPGALQGDAEETLRYLAKAAAAGSPSGLDTRGYGEARPDVAQRSAGY